MTAVPTRLYENVQTISGGFSNAVEPGAESFSRLTYNYYLQMMSSGYSYTWTHSTADPSASGFGVTFFSTGASPNFSYKSTLRWTNIKSARTSLSLSGKALIAIGTSAGIPGQGLFLAHLSYAGIAKTFSSSSVAAVGVTIASKASLLRDRVETSYLYFCGTVGSSTHLFKITLTGFTTGGTIPTANTQSTFSFPGEDSIAEWLKIGDYFAFWSSAHNKIYLNPALDFTNTNPEVTLTTDYATRYAVLDQSPPVDSLYTFYTVSADAKTLQVETLNLQTPASTSVLTVTATNSQSAAYFLSKPVQIKNTRHLALMTKTGSANYFLRLFDGLSATLAEVSTFTPVDLGSDYREHTLETPGGGQVGHAYFAAQFGNTVRSFFLIGDSCTDRAADICTTCPPDYTLDTPSQVDNDCRPDGYQRVSGIWAQVLKLCGNIIPSCGVCSPTECITCDQVRTPYYDTNSVIVACYDYGDPAPPGYGFTLDDELERCSTTNCQECAANYQQCTKCKAPQPVLKKVSGGTSDVCVETNVAPGFGIDTSDSSGNTIRACTASRNCATCPSDFSSCATCGGSFPVLKITGGSTANTCVSVSAVTGFGSDTSAANPTIRPCVSALNCNSCTADYTSCTSCLAAKPMLVPVSGKNACYAEANIPDGYGKDVSKTNVAAACQEQGCKKCQTDHTQCTQCLDTAFIKSSAVAPLDCYPTVNDIPAGFGPQATDSKILVACSTTQHCAACTGLFDSCTTCASTHFLYTPSGGKAGCYGTGALAIPDGVGPDIQGNTKTLIPCLTTSQCLKCVDDHRYCSECSSTGYYIMKYVADGAGVKKGQCLQTTQLPLTLWGLDSAVPNSIRPCVSTYNCATCDDDYLKCKTCPSNKIKQTLVNSGHIQCVTETNIDYYGLVSGTGSSLVPCSVSSCKNCFDNYLSCTVCELPNVFLKVVGGTSPNTCVAANNLQGYGLDTTVTNTIKQCTDSLNCETCTADYTTCTTCPSNKPFHVLVSSKLGCFTEATLPDGYGKDISKTNEAAACQEQGCKKCQADHTQCTECLNTAFVKKSALAPLDCYPTVNDIPAGFGPEITNSNILVACSTSQHCTTCTGLFDSCTTCASTHFLYTSSSGKAGCYGTGALAIPDGVGPDIQGNTKTLISCAAASSCKSCTADQRYCTSCNINDYLKTVGSVSDCHTVGSFPAGFGPDLASSNPKTAAVCLATQNCESCANDHTKCSACASGLGFPILKYVMSGNLIVKDSCVASGTTQNGYGPDATEASTLKPCLATNKCVLCPVDIKKCTTCAPGEFLLVESVDSTKCVTEANIPDGKGKETDAAANTQARALACQIASCAKCAADYKTSCTECSGSLYLSALGVDLGSPKCVELANIPEGYRGTAARTTEACSTTNCAACTTAAATCTACKSTYFLHSPNGQCLQNTPSIPGYRFGTGVTEQCATGCKVCDAAVATCTECFPGQFINSATCYTTATIPDGFGVSSGDTSIAQLVSCGVSGCAKCAPNHSQCTKCTSGLVHFDDTTWSCESTLPSGYGNDPSSSPPVKTIKCQKNNCDVCATDYTRCSTCKTGTSTYLEEGLGACYTKTQFPTGFGLNTADSKVTACSTTGCDLCVEDHTACTKCQNNNGFYMKGTDSCIKKEAFAAGEGVNPTTLLVEKCIDTNCLDCRDDIGVCKSCSTTTGYYLLKTACISKAQIAAGQGISATNGTVEKCASGNCADCFEDFSKCVKCTDSTVFTLSAGKCSEANKGPVVDAQAIRIKASSGSVAIPLGSDQSRVVDSIIVFDLLEGKSYTGNELGVTITIDSTGIGLKFSTSIRIQKGRLRINRRASENNRLLSTGRMLLDASPIIIEDFVLLQSSWVASLTDALTVILSILRLLASLLLFWKYPWAAMAVDTTATQLTYLGLLDGDSLAYPRLVFEMVSALKILPFRFANPFLRWNEATTNCVPLDSYAALGYYCSWLDNYGENFIALLSLVMLALVVHFALGYVLQKVARESKMYRIITAIQQAYGGRFVMAKLDANHLEVVIFAIANYARGATGGKGVLSIILGTGLLVMLIFMGLLKTKMLRSNYKPAQATSVRPIFADKMNPERTILRQAAAGTPKRTEPSTESVAAPATIGQPMQWFSYVSQNREPAGSLGTALYYVFQYSRTLVLAILTLNLADKTWVLLMLAIFVEVAYTAYLIKCSNFRVQIERYSQLALQSLTILYLLLKAISTNEKLSDTAKFTSFSNVLAVVLLMMVVVPIFLAFCAAIDVFYPFMSPKEIDAAQEQQNREWGSPKVTEKVAAPQAGDECSEQFGIRDQQNPEGDFDLPIPNEVAHSQHASLNLKFENRRDPTKGVVAVEPVYIGRDDDRLAPPDDLSVSMSGEHNSPHNP